MKMRKILTIIALVVAVISLTACTTKKEETNTNTNTDTNATAAPTQAVSSEESAERTEILDFKGTSMTPYKEGHFTFRLKQDMTYVVTLSLPDLNRISDIADGTWEYTDDTFTLTGSDGKVDKSTINEAGEYAFIGKWTKGALVDQEVNVVASKDAVAAFVPAE